MQTRLGLLFTASLLAGLVGCQGEPSSTLPTSTPGQTQAIQTPTATFLPPPTVTSFPTATARGDIVVAVSPSGSEAAGTAVTVVGSTEAPTNPPAGSPAPSDTPTLPPPPTSTPAPTAPPFKLPDGVNLGDKLFSADFFQGWPTENFPTVKMGIKDGKYVLEIGPQDAGIRSSGVVKQKNLFQQIEVTPNSCPTKTGFGLRFRMQDNSNYYRFSIFCDNTFISSAVVSGGVTELVSGKLPGGLDVTVSDLHTIGVAAFNDGFTFYLDDQIVGTANDNRLDQGDVAFYAFSQATSVIQVAFDNWQVWSLR